MQVLTKFTFPLKCIKVAKLEFLYKQRYSNIMLWIDKTQMQNYKSKNRIYISVKFPFAS